MVDPALVDAELPPGTLTLDQVPRQKSGVYVFDFDGVLSSGIEDAVYRIEEDFDRSYGLDRIGKAFNVNLEGYDHRYKRHLLFQVLQSQRRRPIEPGPGLALGQWAAKNAKCFILTARSGWKATARIRTFLERHEIIPLELFQVGRTAKTPQIELVCREFPKQTVFYIEDSKNHLNNAKSIESDNLKLVFCENSVGESEARDLLRRAIESKVVSRNSDE